MPGRRLLTAAGAMALVAWALSVLAPDLPSAVSALATAQQTLREAGPEALVEALTGLLAWGVWAWGALGLLLTATGALPGAAGAMARRTARHVLPRAARSSAAIVLGVGLGVGGPLLVLASPAGASTPAGGAPDWPAAPSDPRAPDPEGPQPGSAGGPTRQGPGAPAGATHVVAPGDCLWDLAEAQLIDRGDRPAVPAVAAATTAWWTANAAVIGGDPDLLLPGQVLRAPELP